MAHVAIGIVGSKPADLAAGRASGAVYIQTGDTLWITGIQTVGAACNYSLLRWCPDLLQWRHYRVDSPMPAATTTRGGEFDGRYEVDKNHSAYWLLYADQTVTATAHVEPQHLRT